MRLKNQKKYSWFTATAYAMTFSMKRCVKNDISDDGELVDLQSGDEGYKTVQTYWRDAARAMESEIWDMGSLVTAQNLHKIFASWVEGLPYFQLERVGCSVNVEPVLKFLADKHDLDLETLLSQEQEVILTVHVVTF